jgi:hypothetical protein
VLTAAAVAAMLLTAAAAHAKKSDARPNPRKAEPGACIQMDLSVTQQADGHFLVQVEVAEECKGTLYADLHIEVDGQEVAQARADGAALFAQEAEIDPRSEPFEVCAWMEGELQDRKKSDSVYRSECTLIRPLEIETQ